jgi:truncated hemoglobin YjbI
MSQVRPKRVSRRNHSAWLCNAILVTQAATDSKIEAQNTCLTHNLQSPEDFSFMTNANDASRMFRSVVCSVKRPKFRLSFHGSVSEEGNQRQRKIRRRLRPPPIAARKFTSWAGEILENAYSQADFAPAASHLWQTPWPTTAPCTVRHSAHKWCKYDCCLIKKWKPCGSICCPFLYP